MVDPYGRKEEEGKAEGREGGKAREGERENRRKINWRSYSEMEIRCLSGEITNEFSSLCFSEF